ncbi:MAG TPA: hypothetical protein VF517_02130 [Thermoleophilaceae bacterium]|jgi:hypothetical protein
MKSKGIEESMRSLGFLAFAVAVGAWVVGGAGGLDAGAVVAVVGVLLSLGAFVRAVRRDELPGATMWAVAGLALDLALFAGV